MKRPYLTILAAVSITATSQLDAALVAYWNFNSLTTSTNNGTSYAPDSGAGTLDLVGWTTTATSGITAFAGSTLNAISPDGSGQSLALQGGPTGGTVDNNGASLVMTVDLTGLEDPVLTFASRNTSTGFGSNQVSYSTDGSTYTDFGSPYSLTTSFALQTFDLSAINTLDGSSTVFLRITFAGATNITGNNRIDNIQINAVPEPSVALLGGLGLLGLIRRRR